MQEFSQPGQGEYTSVSAARVEGVDEFASPQGFVDCESIDRNQQVDGRISGREAPQERQRPDVRPSARLDRSSREEGAKERERVGRGSREERERLVSKKAQPDFWTLPQELIDAQQREARGGGSIEKMSGRDERLQRAPVNAGVNTFAAKDVDAYVYPNVY
jgi:hypothetical protein